MSIALEINGIYYNLAKMKFIEFVEYWKWIVLRSEEDRTAHQLVHCFLKPISCVMTVYQIQIILTIPQHMNSLYEQQKHWKKATSSAWVMLTPCRFVQLIFHIRNLFFLFYSFLPFILAFFNCGFCQHTRVVNFGEKYIRNRIGRFWG